MSFRTDSNLQFPVAQTVFANKHNITSQRQEVDLFIIG